MTIQTDSRIRIDQRGKSKPEPNIEAKIHGRWYPVDLLDVIEVKTTDGLPECKVVQVEVKPINGKQFKPFKGYLSKIYSGMESAVGSVPVDHIRVDGKQLEVK
jgi:hypothetical protein